MIGLLVIPIVCSTARNWQTCSFEVVATSILPTLFVNLIHNSRPNRVQPALLGDVSASNADRRYCAREACGCGIAARWRASSAGVSAVPISGQRAIEGLIARAADSRASENSRPIAAPICATSFAEPSRSDKVMRLFELLAPIYGWFAGPSERARFDAFRSLALAKLRVAPPLCRDW